MRVILSVVFSVAVVVSCGKAPELELTEKLIDEESFISDWGERRRAGDDTVSSIENIPRTEDVSRVGIARGENASPFSPDMLLGVQGLPLEKLGLNAVPLQVFTKALAIMSGYNIVIDPSINPLLRIDLKSVDWRDALHLIADIHSFEIVQNDRLIYIKKSDTPRPTAANQALASDIELFRLRYADPDSIKKLLTPLMQMDAANQSPGNTVITVDRRTNSIIVKGTSNHIALAESLIRNVDIRTHQIMIEAFIVEAGDDFERNLGARLGRAPDGVIDTTRGPYIDFPETVFSGGLGVLFGHGRGRFKLELTALENEGKSRIISNPRIFTLDNQQAIIFQGDEVPYQTVSDQGTRTQFKQAGLRLQVTPSVVDAGQLMLAVSINKDTVDTRISNPPITRRELTSHLLVNDGDIVVIGGIYLDSRIRSTDSVPIVSSVPVFGQILSRRRNERDVRELLVFISPKIIL